MASLVIKKPAAGNFTINDVGVTIPGLGQESFTNNSALIRSLCVSNDTRNAVSAGTLVVNDGIQDLSSYNGLVYLNNLWVIVGFGFEIGTGIFPYQPKRMTRQWSIQQNSGLTTIANTGFVNAPLLSGTASTIVTADGYTWINYLSGATAGVSNAGWLSSAFSQVRRDNRPVHTMWVRTGAAAADITGVRIWNGLFQSDPTGSPTPAGTQLAGFRYDTGVDGTTFWRCVTSNGATFTTTTTTVAVVADTAYEFAIDMTNQANVRFFINGVLVATHTTDLPATTTNIGHAEQLRTLVAAGKNYRISRIFMEHL